MSFLRWPIRFSTNDLRGIGLDARLAGVARQLAQDFSLNQSPTNTTYGTGRPGSKLAWSSRCCEAILDFAISQNHVRQSLLSKKKRQRPAAILERSRGTTERGMLLNLMLRRIPATCFCSTRCSVAWGGMTEKYFDSYYATCEG